MFNRDIFQDGLRPLDSYNNVEPYTKLVFRSQNTPPEGQFRHSPPTTAVNWILAQKSAVTF